MAMLSGKTAIVSGAAQGLGLAIAKALGAEGANLVLFDVKAAVEAEAKALAAASVPVTALVADVSRRADCEAVVREAQARFGGVDILVNNAAIWRQTPVTDSWDKAVADFDEIMDTNVRGVMMMSRLVVPIMKARGGGDIVNISSDYVLPDRGKGTNAPGTDVYNASKWALNGLTDAAAILLEPDNIRVNGLAISATDTPMIRGLFPGCVLPAELEKILMQPADVAGLLVALLKDGRTGENIGAWGGTPLELGPRKRADVRMRERADFTGRPLVVYGPPPWTDAPEPVAEAIKLPG